MRKIVIILAVIVVIVVGGVTLLLFNLERIVNAKKGYILERAETELGRNVQIGDIGVAFSGGMGVRLSDVAIADDSAFSGGQFVQAENLTVQVKLLPLIKKEVEVKRLVLNKPVINIIRDEEGRFNYESLAPLQKSGSASQPPGTVERTSAAPEPSGDTQAAAPAAALPLVLAFADIKGGQIHFVDRQGGLDLTANKLNLTVKNFGLDDEMSIEFGAAVLAENEDVVLEGSVGPVGSFSTTADLVDVPVRMKATLGPFETDDVRNVIPNHPALPQLVRLELGAITCEIELAGTMGALQISQIGLGGAVLGAAEPNLSLSATAGPINALEAGEGLPADMKLSGEVELAPVALAKVLAFSASGEDAAAPPPDLKTAGDAAVKASFEGSAQSLGVKAELDLTNGSIEIPEKFLKPAGVPMSATAELVASKTGIEIKDSEVALGSFSAKADGKVDLKEGGSDVDLQVRSGKNDVSGLSEFLPMLAKMGVKGMLSLRANVKGPVGERTQPDVSGTANITEGSAKIEQMPEPVTNLNATVNFTADNANLENTSFRVGRSDVRVDGQAVRLKPLKANYTITSKEAFRSDFQVIPPENASPRTEVLKDVALQGQVEQYGDAINLTGNATSTSGTVANVDYTDLTASIKSTEDKILIESFSAKSLDGTLEGSGTFEPKQTPPRFNITSKLRRINLAEYFNYKFQSLPKFIEGRIDLDLNLGGAGKNWDEIRTTLEGTGGAIVIDGALLNLNIAEELLSGLARIPLVDGASLTRIREKYPKLFSSNTTAFENLKAELIIADGKINSGDLVLKAADYSVTANGWFSFDRKINMDTSVILSAAMTQSVLKELPVAKYILNEQGVIEIPLTLDGDAIKPKVILDTETLTQRIQQSTLQEGVNQLQDKLKGEVGDKVKDLFSGFGKKKTAKKDTTKTP